jgi:hypothetical protein
MLRIVGKCIVSTKQITCKTCYSILEYTQDEVKVCPENGHILCPCCSAEVIVWQLQYEERKVLAHSLKHIDYVNSLKRDDPVVIWRGSLADSEKLHFRFIDHIAGVPTIFCYADGTTSHTNMNNINWMGWYLYHDNYIVDLKLIKTQILKAHPNLTYLQRSLK